MGEKGEREHRMGPTSRNHSEHHGPQHVTHDISLLRFAVFSQSGIRSLLE
ncbi:hypothetical protein CGRA01v4_03375 [Colletotrichum graminicola]|nr:hypothetical protein CGRA01v4_03375 [Colletotrichum graminicola]